MPSKRYQKKDAEPCNNYYITKVTNTILKKRDMLKLLFSFAKFLFVPHGGPIVGSS